MQHLDQEGRLTYPGWRIVIAMFLVTVVVFGESFYGFIILARPLAAERGWSASQTGGFISAAWFAFPLALFCAPVIERVGAWRFMFAGVIILSATFAALAIGGGFWLLYGLRTIMGVAKIIVMVAVPIIVSQWFSHRFALAIALSLCGAACGGLLYSPATQAMVDAFGWRQSAIVFSLLLLLVLGAAAALQRSAARASGAAATPSTDTATSASGRDKIDWQQVRTISPLTAGVMALAVTGTGMAILTHAMETPPLLMSFGFSPTVGATALGVTAAGIMAGDLLGGWILDRWETRLAAMAAGALIACGLTIFYLLQSHLIAPMAYLGGAMFGVGIGATEIIWVALTRRQFGTTLFPFTYSGWYFFYQLGYLLAGSIGGAAYAALDHSQFLLVIALMCLPSLIFSLWRPHMRNVEENPTPQTITA